MKSNKHLPFNILSLSPIFYDFIAVGFIWFIAFSLRFNFNIPEDNLSIMRLTILPVMLVHSLSFSIFGIYRGLWQFCGLLDLKRIIFAASFSLLIILLITYMGKFSFIIPRSVLIINSCLLILIIGGSRVLYRYIKEHRLYRLNKSKAKPVIIVGAGEEAVLLIKELLRSESWQVVGILDDDVSIHGRDLLGITIYGSIYKLKEFANLLDVKYVILAMPSINHQIRRNILGAANAAGLSVFTVPTIDDLISGRLSISQLRAVEVEDLLRRDTVNLDGLGLHNLITGNSVLVSGSGGSIGSELCRQIIKFNPSLLVCLDISEYSLYQLEQELSNQGCSSHILYVVGNVKNASRLDKLLALHQPKIVFHAAAYKHVPLMEVNNVSEAINNNVLGTYMLAKASKRAKVERFVLVSTDKAVNPTNVMGATKRLSEKVCQGLQDKRGTRFMVVRFGNVLGSSGSVIPKFREQIKAGGPLTVTHPEITRYFMSIPEASQLVLQAGLMGDGGEIFVLDMGEPVRIVDLAKDMIKLSGLQEDEIAIEYTGLRPGEKLYEELLADDEYSLPTHHEKLRIVSSKAVHKAWVESLVEWIVTIEDKNEMVIKQELKSWVEEYSPDLRKY